MCYTARRLVAFELKCSMSLIHFWSFSECDLSLSMMGRGWRRDFSPSTFPFSSLDSPSSPVRTPCTSPKEQKKERRRDSERKEREDVDIIHNQLLLLQRLVLGASSPLPTPTTTLHPLTGLPTPPETPNANQIPSVLLLPSRRGPRNTTTSLRARTARALHHRKAKVAPPSLPRLGRYQRRFLPPGHRQQDQAPFNAAVGWPSGNSFPTTNRCWSPAVPADVYYLR